jgi:hypothetical protein
MFQFPESRFFVAIYSLRDDWLYQPGSPIRTSPDRYVLTTPRCISLFAASFFASLCLGIHHTLLFAFPRFIA